LEIGDPFGEDETTERIHVIKELSDEVNRLSPESQTVQTGPASPPEAASAENS